jgi:general secretion pathway protein D
VRSTERIDATLTEFWSGTEGAVRTRSPFVETLTDVALRAGEGAGALATTATTAGALSNTRAPVPAVPVTLSWQAPAAIQAGAEFMVALQARSDAPIKGASVQLRYDVAQLAVLAVEDGGFFDPVGGRAVFTPRIDPTQGVVFATLGATGAAATPGNGPLVRLRLKALHPASTTTLQVGPMVAVDAANQRVPIEGWAPLALTSRP